LKFAALDSYIPSTLEAHNQQEEPNVDILDNILVCCFKI